MERLTTRNIAGVAVYKNPFENVKDAERQFGDYLIMAMEVLRKSCPLMRMPRNRDCYCSCRARWEINYIV